MRDNRPKIIIAYPSVDVQMDISEYLGNYFEKSSYINLVELRQYLRSMTERPIAIFSNFNLEWIKEICDAMKEKYGEMGRLYVVCNESDGESYLGWADKNEAELIIRDDDFENNLEMIARDLSDMIF